MKSRMDKSSLWIALAILAAFAGCSDDESKSGAGSDDAGSDETADASLPPAFPPLALGEAIPVTEDKKWTWVDFPETRCMDDSATGLGIRFNKDSDKVLVVIQGGGACFNQATCLVVFNKNGFGEANLASSVTLGLLNTEDADNPFKDWNLVFIPYCSGDTFSGNATDGAGFEGRTQSGYKNFQEYLKRLVPTFKDSSHVVLSGYSAGGFAAAINWPQAREAWGQDKRVDVLDDSGPTMGPKYLTPCLQQRMAQTWNWEGTIPESCKECDAKSGNVTLPSVEWSIPYTKNGRLGLISSDEDDTIKRFFGYGQEDCKNLDGFQGYFPPGLYPQGLAELRTTFKDHPGVASFIVRSTQHVWTTTSPGKVMSNGVVLRDWINDFLDLDKEFKDVLPAE